MDEDFSLRSAARFGQQYAEAIRSLVIYPNEGDSRSDLVCRYLDHVADVLVSGCRHSNPVRRQSVTVDLASEDFIGLEWGYSVENSLGQKWRYLGPRDRSQVLLTLGPGNDYDVAFDILDLKPGLEDKLAIECNDDVLPTEIRADAGRLVATARVPAGTVARDVEVTRIGLIVPGSPNASRPGNSLTEVAANRASLTEMRVRPAGNGS